jgi:hypothetical protein
MNAGRPVNPQICVISAVRQTADGRAQVGRIYQPDALVSLDASEQAYIVSLGIKVVWDLRSPGDEPALRARWVGPSPMFPEVPQL